MIDIEEVSGKKTYRIGLPPEEIFSRIEEHLLSGVIIPDETVWLEHGFSGDRSRRYTVNNAYHYALWNSSLTDSYEVREKLVEKFFKDNLDHEVIEGYRDNTPYGIRILIKKVDEMGCECEGTCFSALYEKLGKGITDEDDVTDYCITDSKYECLQFLDDIFIGLLGGEIIKDTEKDEWTVELLMNDSGIREITNMINKLLDEATTEILICGWIGTYYIPKLRQLKSLGVNVKFITHKPGEARNQPWKSEVEEAYKLLIADFNLDAISNAFNVHGRMIIVDNKALIGTMDLNSASLTGAHTEFAILTDKPNIVRRMRAIFNTKFRPLSV